MKEHIKVSSLFFSISALKSIPLIGIILKASLTFLLIGGYSEEI
jgi:hypothetical protein